MEDVIPAKLFETLLPYIISMVAYRHPPHVPPATRIYRLVPEDIDIEMHLPAKGELQIDTKKIMTYFKDINISPIIEGGECFKATFIDRELGAIVFDSWRRKDASLNITFHNKWNNPPFIIKEGGSGYTNLPPGFAGLPH